MRTAALPNDDNRKFTELCKVERLRSPIVARDGQVCISSIQRMYALLKDEPLDEAAEEIYVMETGRTRNGTVIRKTRTTNSPPRCSGAFAAKGRRHRSAADVSA